MNTNVTMTDFIRKSVDADDEKIIFRGERIRAKRFFDDVDALSASLVRMGVRKGDVAIIALPNIPQAIVALYALNQIGAVADILHPKCGEKAMEKAVRETGAMLAFVFADTYKQYENVWKSTGIGTILCRLHDRKNGKTPSGKQWEYRTLTQENKPIREESGLSGDDVAVYLHSSGTTADSKTVVLTNRALNEAAKNVFLAVDPYVGIQKDYAMLMTLPMYHGFGLSVCVHLMMFCGKIVMLPRFRAGKAVRLMRKYPITYLSLVPNMLRRLVERKGGKKAWRSVRQIYVGGDRLSAERKESAEALLKRYGVNGKICEGYGLSETSGVLTINENGKPGSVGKPVYGVKIRITDEEGRDLPTGETGNITVCSPAVAKEYLGEPIPVFTDKNGEKWLETGDTGYLDADGNLFYAGRKKRMIKIGGVAIFPKQVEEIAEKVSGVKSACAVRTIINGKPSLKLYLEAKPSERLKRRVCEEIEKGIMPYATPRAIGFLPEIKRTEMGKTDYRYYEEIEKL